MEVYLDKQPAHMAAQRSAEVAQVMNQLQSTWREPQFITTVLPEPPQSFRSQLRQQHSEQTHSLTLAGGIITNNPRQGRRKMPTAAKVAAAELCQQQAIAQEDEQRERGVEDSIIVSHHKRRKVGGGGSSSKELRPRR